MIMTTRSLVPICSAICFLLASCVSGSSFDFNLYKSDDCSGDAEHVNEYKDGQCYSTFRGRGSSYGLCSQDMKSVEFHWYEMCSDCACSVTTIWSEPVGTCFPQGDGVAGSALVTACHDAKTKAGNNTLHVNTLSPFKEAEQQHTRR